MVVLGLLAAAAGGLYAVNRPLFLSLQDGAGQQLLLLRQWLETTTAVPSPPERQQPVGTGAEPVAPVSSVTPEPESTPPLAKPAGIDQGGGSGPAEASAAPEPQPVTEPVEPNRQAGGESDATAAKDPAPVQQDIGVSQVEDPVQVEAVAGVEGDARSSATDKPTPDEGQISEEAESLATSTTPPLLAEPAAEPTQVELVPLPTETILVRFDNDSSELLFPDLQDIDALVTSIRQHPQAVMVISGHTDAFGSEGYNYRLSLFRANMVKSFFLGKGVDGGQLRVQAFGSERPIADNTTAEGRSRNRRVEIDIEQ